MRRALPGILIGGVAGSATRWAVGEIAWSVPTTLLVVNTFGAAILGMIAASWPDHHHPTRLALGLGFCGGVTTFSGLAVELAERLDAGSPGQALLLTGGSLAAGITAFLAGRAAVTTSGPPNR